MERSLNLADNTRYDDCLDVNSFQKIIEALSGARILRVDVNIGVSAKILSRLERARPYGFESQIFRRLYSRLLHVSPVG